MLTVEISHALALLLELLDRRQVDRAKALNPVAQRLDSLLPGVNRGILRHLVMQLLAFESRLGRCSSRVLLRTRISWRFIRDWSRRL